MTSAQESFCKDPWDNNTTTKTTDEVMSTYTRGRPSPQGQYNIAGKRNSNVFTLAQHGVVPIKADGVDQPFPNKAVSHRRPLNHGRQDLYHLDKSTITKQPRGPLSPQEHNSNGSRKTSGSREPRKDLRRQPSGELQMARAIHAKELVLQEKLWSVEEKIRQKIQRDAGVRYDQKSEEQRQDRGQAERGYTETTRKDHRRSHQITVHEQMSEELNKSRWGNVKEHTRRKGRDEKDDGIWGETGVKSHDGEVKAKERGPNTTSPGDKGYTREKKYGERTCKEISDNQRDMPQMSQPKTSHKGATENHRGAGGKLSGGPLLPPVSRPSRSSGPEQGDLRQEDGTDTSLQLLPCRVCNRKFAVERLQKHVQVCKKVKQSHREVFNSYVNRTKGSAIEQYWKTHSKSPEVLKTKNQRQSHKANTKNLHEGHLPVGTSQPKWSK